MSDVSGIPNLGIPGLSGFNGGGGVNGIPGSSGLASAYEQALQNQRFFGNQAATMATANAYDPWANTPGGFGGQTAAYAGAGAAYGRGTGGFGMAPGGGRAAPGRVGTIGNPGGGAAPSSVPVASSPFDVGNAGAVPYLSGGGLPFGGGGFGRRSTTVFDTGAQGIPYSPPPGSFSPSPNYPGGSGDTFASRFGAAPPVNAFLQPPSNQGALDAVQQFNGRGTGVSAAAPAAAPAAPSSPGADFNERFNIETSAVAGAPGSFADRFAAGGYFQPGQPSEYTTSPYQDAGGTMRGPMQMPPGFSTPFGADDPSGALTRQMRQNIGQAPIMNQGGDESPFDTGAPHIGPTMGPFMGATPGGGVGRYSAPQNFAPSSPFEGGVSSLLPYQYGQAFPGGGVGSAQGSMRDRIAAIMSGSQGNQEPASYDKGAIANGVPTPTQPQMNDAWRRIRAGPGSPGVSSIAQQVPPPQSGYAPINQAISSIGSVSRPGMFDNLSQPLGSMFSPGQYRGAPPVNQPTPSSPPFNTKAGPITRSDIDQAFYLSGAGGRFLR